MIGPSFRPTDKQLRQFAWISLPGFALFGWLALRSGGSMELALSLAAVGAVLCLVGSLVPRAVLPVYLAMTAAFARSPYTQCRGSGRPRT